jgi:hypothetical protein
LYKGSPAGSDFSSLQVLLPLDVWKYVLLVGSHTSLGLFQSLVCPSRCSLIPANNRGYFQLHFFRFCPTRCPILLFFMFNTQFRFRVLSVCFKAKKFFGHEEASATLLSTGGSQPLLLAAH